MNINQFPFEAKDQMRIADILRKSKGSVTKARQLASNMARAITKSDKALRRARAAEDVNEHCLANIFFIRYTDLVSK